MVRQLVLVLVSLELDLLLVLGVVGALDDVLVEDEVELVLELVLDEVERVLGELQEELDEVRVVDWAQAEAELVRAFFLVVLAYLELEWVLQQLVLIHKHPLSPSKIGRAHV